MHQDGEAALSLGVRTLAGPVLGRRPRSSAKITPIECTADWAERACRASSLPPSSRLQMSSLSREGGHRRLRVPPVPSSNPC